MNEPNLKNQNEYLSDRVVCMLIWLVFCVAGLIFALRLNVPPVLDEVGILANSAYMVGYDWSETVYTMGGYYYKYGISILYAPFLKLIDNPYAVYKSIMAFNMIIYSFIPVIAYRILKNHLGTARKQAVIMACISGLLPSCFLYQMYAKADSMLIFIPWLVLLILFELDKTEKDNKTKRALLSILLAFTGVYAFAVHTRGIVVVIATVMTVLLARLINKKKLANIPVYLASTIVFLAADKLISNVFYDGVYGIYGTGHASAESFDFEYLKKIFSAEGMRSFLKLITGWLYDGINVSFGIILIGGICGILLILKRKNAKHVIFSLFAVLNFLGSFGMGVIFFFPSANRYYIGEMISRSDRLIYDRYMATGYGPLILLGIYILFIRTDYCKKAVKFISGFIYAGVFAGFFIKCAGYLEGVTGCARYFIAMCPFLSVDGGQTFDAFENIKQALLFAGIFDAAVFLLLMITVEIVKKEKIRTYIGGGIVIAASVFLIISCYCKIRISRDESLYRWTKEPAELLNELSDLADEYPVLWDNSAKDIKHYRFLCKKYIVGSYCTDTSKADNCFIISKKNRFIKDYFNDDYYTFACFDYENTSKDMVYVKGEALKERLENMGYEMLRYTGRLKPVTLPDTPMKFISKTE